MPTLRSSYQQWKKLQENQWNHQHAQQPSNATSTEETPLLTDDYTRYTAEPESASLTAGFAQFKSDCQSIQTQSPTQLINHFKKFLTAEAPEAVDRQKLNAIFREFIDPHGARTDVSEGVQSATSQGYAIPIINTLLMTPAAFAFAVNSYEGTMASAFRNAELACVTAFCDGSVNWILMVQETNREMHKLWQLIKDTVKDVQERDSTQEKWEVIKPLVWKSLILLLLIQAIIPCSASFPQGFLASCKSLGGEFFEGVSRLEPMIKGVWAFFLGKDALQLGCKYLDRWFNLTGGDGGAADDRATLLNILQGKEGSLKMMQAALMLKAAVTGNLLAPADTGDGSLVKLAFADAQGIERQVIAHILSSLVPSAQTWGEWLKANTLEGIKWGIATACMVSYALSTSGSFNDAYEDNQSDAIDWLTAWRWSNSTSTVLTSEPASWGFNALLAPLFIPLSKLGLDLIQRNLTDLFTRSYYNPKNLSGAARIADHIVAATKDLTSLGYYFCTMFNMLHIATSADTSNSIVPKELMQISNIFLCAFAYTVNAAAGKTLDGWLDSFADFMCRCHSLQPQETFNDWQGTISTMPQDRALRAPACALTSDEFKTYWNTCLLERPNNMPFIPTQTDPAIISQVIFEQYGLAEKPRSFINATYQVAVTMAPGAASSTSSAEQQDSIHESTA